MRTEIVLARLSSTWTSKVARLLITNIAEECGKWDGTVGWLSFLELASRAMRSCRSAPCGVMRAFFALATVYAAAAEAAGAACGRLELALPAGDGGSAALLERTQV